MSRFRANLSSSPLDREIQSQVAVAERALERALGACRSARKSDEYQSGYVARVRRDLERALGSLQGVRRVVPGFDLSDPDLLSTAPYEPPPPVVKEPVVEAPSEEEEGE